MILAVSGRPQMALRGSSAIARARLQRDAVTDLCQARIAELKAKAESA